MACRSGRAGPNIPFVVKFDLARVGVARWQAELDQRFGLRVETVDRVITRAADPDDAVLVDVQRERDLIFCIR